MYSSSSLSPQTHTRITRAVNPSHPISPAISFYMFVYCAFQLRKNALIYFDQSAVYVWFDSIAVNISGMYMHILCRYWSNDKTRPQSSHPIWPYTTHKGRWSGPTPHTRAVSGDWYTFVYAAPMSSLALYCTQGRDGTYHKLVKPLKTPSGTLVSLLSDRSRLLWACQTWVDEYSLSLFPRLLRLPESKTLQ